MTGSALNTAKDWPLPIGTTVKPWGKVGAILLTGGERYYLFSKDRGRCCSMIPAFMVHGRTQ